MLKKVQVRVKPNSKKGNLVQPDLEGHLLVYTKEPAVDGRANAAVVDLLSDYFDVAKSQVRIVHGYSSRQKLVEISLPNC